MIEFSSCVIVYTPQGVGKTINAEKLRKLFGCKSIVDEWDGKRQLPERALVFTNVMPWREAA